MRQSPLRLDTEKPRLNAEDNESAAAAEYIAELSAELTRLAARHRLDMLAYLLDMARLEAEATAEGLSRSPQARQ